MNIALTEDLLARTERKIEDAGPAPGLRSLEDRDYFEIRRQLLAGRSRDGGVWVFAYGSLLWNPCFEFVEETPATVHGWHRRFSLWLTRWRGTRERPGLMLALDRGGSCRGAIYRIPDRDVDAAIDRLLRREMSANPPTNIPRWVSVRSAGRNLRAIAFVVDRTGPAYAAALPEQITVEILSLAAGHIGSCADYLRRTVVQLEARNIRDAMAAAGQSRRLPGVIAIQHALATTSPGDRSCMRRLKDLFPRRSWHRKPCIGSCRRAVLNFVAAKRCRCCTISTL
ncbi:MAG: gamma-glutamylcyclotransferase [Mesorhizobium sp.]|nr:MAG: gamma-glutamylcyclotransferase [Mesorhizobium sp.]